MKNVILALLLTFSLAVFAGQKNWQDATVISISTSQGPVVAAPVNGIWVAGRVQWIHYIAETADIRYDLATRKTVNITLRKKTRLATSGQKAFLVDDDGKEVKLAIVSKIAISR